MTIRFTIERNPFLERLVLAGNGRCCCCAREFTGRSATGAANGDPTVEHVIPQNPQSKDLARMRDLRRLIMFPGVVQGVKAAAHASCNRRKGNRAPTGCELVFLMAVNARLTPAREMQSPYSNKAARRRAYKIRKRARAQEAANA